MKFRSELLRRVLVAVPAVGVIGSLAGSIFLGASSVSAAQVTSRSVQMSDSAPSANATYTSGVGSGTNVTYKITFTPSASTIGGIVVDICGNTPLVGDTSCTVPAGFSWGSATPTVTVSGGVAGTWTAGSFQGAGTDAAHPQILKVSNATPEAPTGPITITVDGVINPDATNLTSTHHYSFYARILSFDTAANMNNVTTGYGSASGATRLAAFTGMADYGGAALSVQEAITITARVMETMSLCTSKTVMTANCSGQATPAIELGQDVNGTIVLGKTLSSVPVYSQVSTNATNGYSIYMKSRYACAGLSKDNGTTCEIPPVNAGAATAAAIATGGGAFGVQVGSGTAASGGSGTNTATTRWAQTGTNYIMDKTTANDNVAATYGSLVASSASETPVTNRQADSVNNTYTFGAAASSVTPAGIYSQAFTLVAVGVF